MASSPKVESDISDATLLTVFPYEWVVKDEYTDEGHIAIHVWCLDRDSKPYFLRIEDFPVTCYVELPTIVYGRPFQWNRIAAQKVVAYLNFRLNGAQDHAPIGHSLTFRKKTYYYLGEGLYPMLLLQFKSIQALNHCQNLLKYPLKTREYGTLRCHVWESKIPIVRKLLTGQHMSFSQWFTVQGDYVEESLRISTMDDEYVVDSRTMEPIPHEVCDGWRVYPRILAFDIECYSDNKRIFPSAWHATHVAYMISCIYQVYNHRSTRKRYAIILGPCAEIPSSRLENTEIIHVTTEYELVKAFGKLVLKTDPEIVTGYNIFGFDYKYLHERLTQKMYEWPMMGRLPDGKTVMDNNEWSSGAYGLNVIYDLKMDGRINIDLLPIIRRDYKLLKYTLDFVSNYFLGTRKHDITAPDMFWIYEQLNESERDFKRLCTPETTPVLDEIVQTLEKLFEGCLDQTKTDVFDLYNKRHLLLAHYQTFLRGEEEDLESVCPFVALADVFDVLVEHNAFFEKYDIDKPFVLNAVLRYVLANILMTFVLLYCIQDSELVLDLMEELNIFLGLTQMSSVCGVTIVELFTRGQQIRCVSLLYDIAAHQNFVIDQAAKSGYQYTGGFVYPPVPGLHDNVLCWDFASLYPTIIMAHNIDYTTLVHKSIEHLVPDELCNIIIFEQEEAVLLEPLKEGDKPRTELVTKQYRFKFLNAEKTGHKGLLPQLEEKMVFERRAVRAKGKIEKDPIMREVYEQRQKALKVVCNSFYGFLGVRNGGKMPLMEAAMSVTGKARESILKVSTYIEDTYGGTVVYGDSVTGDTPLLCREILSDGSTNIQIIVISQLYTGRWLHKGEKEYNADARRLEVWSDEGFTEIKHAMRHKTKKRIYRITTHTGVIKVTEDHSLLDKFGNEVKPSDVSCGDQLLTHALPSLPDDGKEIPDAWAWGIFYGDGSCGHYQCPSGVKYSWAINNQNLEYLEKAKGLLEKTHPKNHFKILDTMKSSNVYKLIGGGDAVGIVKKWRPLFYDPVSRYKKVPDILWKASKASREAFYRGYYAADGDKDKNGYNRFDNKGQIGSAGLFFLSKSLGYKVSCNTRKDKLDIYRLTLTKNSQRKPPGIIKKIEDFGIVEDYVYDLETGNHHFSAGVGELVVHNTDSVMATLNITDPLEAIRMGKKLEKELTALFPPPMEMELEKVMRMLSLKKKRYVYATLDWDTGELKLDTKDLHFIGVELARRDRPKWLTDLQLKVLIKIMHLRPFEETLDVVFEAIDKLLAEGVPYTDLITVKGLGASYKNKSAQMAVFAEDLKKLGKPAQPGSRLEYLVVEGDKNELQGHKMRLPETYLERKNTENEEKLDYMFYIKKLQNPIGQLLTVAYKDVIQKLTGEYFGIYARATTRHKYVGFNDPILLIYSAIMANNDHHFIQGAVKYKLHDEKRLYKGPTLIITPLEHIDSIHGE
uniref:DNA polymerase n=1 Tax=Pithovirus LCPAC304 TaxID=2506594 RepID=A0A481ZAC2_9VIRU|nr:MAG: DNA polymerase elongation subunit family B [Pithovirus LCPAC304]